MRQTQPNTNAYAFTLTTTQIYPPLNLFTRALALLACLVLAIALSACADDTPPAPDVEAAAWGAVEDGPTQLFTLRNANGMILKVTDLGATIVELHAPDRDGKLEDITLGFDNPNQYLTDSPYFGCIAGRCSNRIAKGKFTLDGKTYTLATNNGPNHLHGGDKGFDKLIWQAMPVTDSRGASIRFSLTSPDGDEGYPGTLTATVTYTLTNDNRLICEMTATTDAPTLCNLVQHAYWNLAGHDSGPNHDHVLTLYADHYTPVDSALIPTGEIAPVDNTPFDFRTAKPIGRDIMKVGDDPKGYDHNFVVKGDPHTLRPVARVYEPTSGRIMLLSADQPGVQFYAGNFLDGSFTGKGGAVYKQHGSFCLETQTFPDGINQANWDAPILRPGETYRQTMITTFTTDKQEK